MKSAPFLLMGMVVLFLSGCNEIKTNDPQQAYVYWADGEKPIGVEVIHGQYWQSSHLTKEYIVYLEIAASKGWGQQFIQQNHLVEQSQPSTFLLDPPPWFAPDSTFVSYSSQHSGGYSYYFWQPKTGRFLIYEAQL